MILPIESERPGLKSPWFLSETAAVIWRNFGLVPVENIAAVLSADTASVILAASLMGLDVKATPNTEWLRRGYLTIIRNNWHSLDFEGLIKLTGIPSEELAFILKEDDFMWHKMGQMKPFCPKLILPPLDEAVCAEFKAIGDFMNSNNFCEDISKDFSFISDYKKPAKIPEKIIEHDGKRIIYSYFALYGDPLLTPELDPYPDYLLAEYAELGINGIWLQGLLYKLTSYPFDPSMSDKYELRQESLRILTERAAKFGIKVYLYLNEPRAMDDAFYEKYPHFRGSREGDFYALCTSVPEVQDYLYNSAKELFAAVPKLGGFITITMSENLTNCFSRTPDASQCPRCKNRTHGEVVAEVNNLLAAGAHASNPDAAAIVWTWSFGIHANDIISRLNQNQIVQTNSEEAMPVLVNGIENFVADYTIAHPGPGERAKSIWDCTKKTGLDASAKVQVNCTWELAALPFVPLFDNVYKHGKKLFDSEIKNYQLSWTLGGCPAPNLKFFLGASDGYSFEEILKNIYFEASDNVERAQEYFCASMREFPFHIGTLYVGPQNYGPKAPFYAEPTGYAPTMIGFPYDGLEGWRVNYPESTFIEQAKKMAELWSEGVKILDSYGGRKNDAFNELATISGAVLIHLSSMRNHCKFVNLRNRHLAGEKCGNELMEVIRNEREAVKSLIGLRINDSRIGFEASNHYFYSLRDLYEKLLNLDYCEKFFGSSDFNNK